MTPSVKQAIREVFPGHSQADIWALIESFGNGRAHARSAILYNCAIRSSGGSLEALTETIHFATRFPDLFGDYCARWCEWHHSADRFAADYEVAAFLRPLMLNTASFVCWHQFEHNTSHSTLCLRAVNDDIHSARLFIKPWYRETVCIFRDPADFFDTEFQSGTFVCGADAELVLISEIQRLFPKLA